MKLIDVLRQYDPQSLWFYARDLGLKPKPGTDSETLCRMIFENQTQNSGILRRLSVLSDNEYRVLDAVFHDTEIKEADNETLLKLIRFDLAAIDPDDEVRLIDEAAACLQSVCTDADWHLERRQKAWLIRCQQVIVHYWGECSLNQFDELMKLDDSYRPNMDVFRFLAEVPLSEQTILRKENLLRWRSLEHSSMAKAYHQSQKRFDFYVPGTKDEIIDLYENDYDTLDRNVAALKQFCIRESDLSGERIEEALHQAWNDLSYGLDPEGVFRDFSNMVSGKCRAEELFRLFSAMNQTCRRYIYRGQRPADMGKESGKTAGWTEPAEG